MSPRLRRAIARWLVRIARRLHPFRTLTDRRAVNRMDSALNPVSEPAFSYHKPTDRTTLARRQGEP